MLKKGKAMKILKPSSKLRQTRGTVNVLNSFIGPLNQNYFIAGNNALNFFDLNEKGKYTRSAQIFCGNPVNSVDYDNGILATAILNNVCLISTNVLFTKIYSVSLSNEPGKNVFDRFARVDVVKIWDNYVLAESAGLSLYKLENKELKFVKNFDFNMFEFIKVSSKKAFLVSSNGFYVATKDQDKISFNRVQSKFDLLGSASHIQSVDIIKANNDWFVGLYLSNKTYKIFKLDEKKGSLIPKNEIDLSRYTDKSIGFISLVHFSGKFFLLFKNEMVRFDENFKHELIHFLNKDCDQNFLIKSVFVHKVPERGVENLFLSTHQKNKKGVYEDYLKVYKPEDLI